MSAYFLLIYFTIYNYLLFFESDHILFQHHFIHMCVHPSFFFTVFKNWKTKDTFLKRTRQCVGCAFFRNFWMCIFYPADFYLSYFEVVARFSKCKFENYLKKKPIWMPKWMHDTSMYRGFGDESISTNSTQLCAMNGRVYTPRRHRETLIFLKEG